MNELKQHNSGPTGKCQTDATIEVANECLWSSHCTVVADVLVADKLKPTNSVSKNG